MNNPRVCYYKMQYNSAIDNSMTISSVFSSEKGKSDITRCNAVVMTVILIHQLKMCYRARNTERGLYNQGITQARGIYLPSSGHLYLGEMGLHSNT